jgi:protein SCO1
LVYDKRNKQKPLVFSGFGKAKNKRYQGSSVKKTHRIAALPEMRCSSPCGMLGFRKEPFHERDLNRERRLNMESKSRWKKSGWWVAAVASALLATACTPVQTPTTTQPAQEKQPPLNWKVPNFTYKDQNGKPFGLSDLKGKVWIADMVFTQCPDVCPPMTSNMVRLQKKMKAEGVDVQIVSFSVDPRHDTPKVLKDYGKRHNADLSNWHFLTGYKDKEIQQLVRTGFKSIVDRQEPKSKNEPLMINHPTSFFLVGPDGKVVERYDGMKPDTHAILKKIKELK